MSIESVMPSSHLILCHPLLLLPSIFPRIRVFSNELVLHIKLSKYWSFSFSISPSNEYSGLISLRMDWLGLLAVQGTLKESSPTPQFKSICKTQNSGLRSKEEKPRDPINEPSRCNAQEGLLSVAQTGDSDLLGGRAHRTANWASFYGQKPTLLAYYIRVTK